MVRIRARPLKNAVTAHQSNIKLYPRTTLHSCMLGLELTKMRKQPPSSFFFLDPHLHQVRNNRFTRNLTTKENIHRKWFSKDEDYSAYVLLSSTNVFLVRWNNGCDCTKLHQEGLAILMLLDSNYGVMIDKVRGQYCSGVKEKFPES